MLEVPGLEEAISIVTHPQGFLCGFLTHQGVCIHFLGHTRPFVLGGRLSASAPEILFLIKASVTLTGL